MRKGRGIKGREKKMRSGGWIGKREMGRGFSHRLYPI